MEKIKIKDLSDLYKEEYEHYIKYKCPEVKNVYCTGIYFKNENDPDCCGIQISFNSYPKTISISMQERILKAINAACNTYFELEE